MPKAQQLGRYQLLDRIAFGGMAEIFRAQTFDAEGQMHMVAVKRMLNHLVNDEEFLAMLVDEAKVSATLEHENIAKVYEFAKAGEEYFIAMEFIDGKDLRALLDRQRLKGRPVSPAHAAWILMHVAAALHAAHTQRDSLGQEIRIVHRDVSPSNVLLSYSGQVKLCDFGIAKANFTKAQTRTGIIKGKVRYMSPEQAMGRPLDARSDLFSLGTVLYEMLTLEVPFQAPTEAGVIFAVRGAKKRDAREINSELPSELNDVINKLMSRSRSERFQNGAEAAAAAQQFLQGHRKGYRRSLFAQFMRDTFATDIERELRALEDYVVDDGDAGDVGENLIADALAPNAPYTQFTAVRPITGGAKQPTDRTPAPTQAEDAAPNLLSRQETKIVKRDTPPPLHADNTKLLPADRPAQFPNIHLLKTQISDRRKKEQVEAAEPPPESATDASIEQPFDESSGSAISITDGAIVDEEPIDDPEKK